MPNTGTLATEVKRRSAGQQPEVAAVANPEAFLSTKHRHKDSVSQESSPDSPIPEYEEEHEQEVQFSSAEEEGNDNNNSDGGEEEENISSDTTERLHRGNTPASQQLITESQEDIWDPHDNIREDDDIEESITLQQQPQQEIQEIEPPEILLPQTPWSWTPLPQTLERISLPPQTPQAPKSTRRKLEPIDELKLHYDLKAL